jgi:hypothetical protein
MEVNCIVNLRFCPSSSDISFSLCVIHGTLSAAEHASDDKTGTEVTIE